MRDHPALAQKYAIVQHTRGDGIEVGGGQLYPHFRAPNDTEKVGALDFVFLPEQPIGQWPALLKKGGHLVQVLGGKLSVWCAEQAGGAMLLMVSLDIETTPERPRSACVVRYGGFGDMIQASNILPALQREGFTVYVMTTPKGQEVLQHDPHVDHWLIQDTDQVPNPELGGYWEHQAKRFDRFVNLSESVEGTLLAYPGRANHGWPAAVRRAELDKNYFEWTSQLAEVPFTAEAKFYPTAQERAWAIEWLAEFRNTVRGRALRPLEYIPRQFNILWTLAGSSVHKMYPHQDIVIQRLLDAFPDVALTLCGDYACKVLEQGWETNPRVRCTSGELSIRQTMALAQEMDCVVGPETGILNAVGFEQMAKVVMLSHSSANNLSKHWVNAIAVEPKHTACYPCHLLHSDRRYCPEHQATGASMCAFNTDPNSVLQAIEDAYIVWNAMRVPARAKDCAEQTIRAGQDASVRLRA